MAVWVQHGRKGFGHFPLMAVWLSGICSLLPAAQHRGRIEQCITSWEKDPNAKFKVWFLQNAYCFCAIIKLEKYRLGTVCGQLLEWAGKGDVCVCNYLLGFEVYLSPNAAWDRLFCSSSTGEAGLHGEVWLLIFAVVKRSKEGWESQASLSGEEAGLVGRYGCWEEEF